MLHSLLKVIRRYKSSKPETWTTPCKSFDTGIKIYNCVVKDKIPLILANKQYSSWYTCGPTVYDSMHIGHASTYVKFDILQRILRDYFKINLVTSMNITDIDDKIIQKSLESKEDWKKLARRYEVEFWNDMKRLNILMPDIKLRVTENIPEIVEFIRKLLDKEWAYKTKDGSVYFSTMKYNNYGKLQKLNLVDKEHSNKESVLDFALWKSTKEPGEPFWFADWGSIGGSNGRPGWHIECSVLASLLFGNHVDFHAGGVDLRFPHHENEETQSCCYHDVGDWVDYWIHTGHLFIPGDTNKMSKSLKNTISVSDLLKRYSADEFRMTCLLSSYRSSVEFSDDTMTNANAILRKFLTFFDDCNAYTNGIKPRVEYNTNDLYKKIEQTTLDIDEALKDDFNTTKSVEALLDLTSHTSKIINNSDSSNKNADSSSSIKATDNPAAIIAAYNFVSSNLKTFGLLSHVERSLALEESNINFENVVNNIISIRNNIRMNAIESKNKEMFKLCDVIRDSLKASGIEVKDHGKNTSWNFIK